MEGVIDTAFNMGLGAALTLAETCATYDEVIEELTKWLEERKAETSKDIPVTHIQNTEKKVKVRVK